MLIYVIDLYNSSKDAILSHCFHQRTPFPGQTPKRAITFTIILSYTKHEHAKLNPCLKALSAKGKIVTGKFIKGKSADGKFTKGEFANGVFYQVGVCKE